MRFFTVLIVFCVGKYFFSWSKFFCECILGYSVIWKKTKHRIGLYFKINFDLCYSIQPESIDKNSVSRILHIAVTAHCVISLSLATRLTGVSRISVSLENCTRHLEMCFFCHLAILDWVFVGCEAEGGQSKSCRIKLFGIEVTLHLRSISDGGHYLRLTSITTQGQGHGIQHAEEYGHCLWVSWSFACHIFSFIIFYYIR